MLRLECLLGQDDVVQLRQRGLDGRCHRFGQLCWPDSVAFANKQRVLQDIAQAVQRIGQRRLRNAQAGRCACHVALFHQRQKDREQIQVVSHTGTNYMNI